ncbi:MAG: hypothetical protein RLZZ502_1396 [Pseudomonadota bacterium]
MRCINPRDYTSDNYARVDDRPFGGGPGMVMLYAPLAAATSEAKRSLPKAQVWLMSPLGPRFSQKNAQAWSHTEELILVCGRYEGLDQRYIDEFIDAHLSLGDFVLSGGEYAALAMLDASIRLLPDAVQDPESVVQESFTQALLDHPHYTRPVEINGQEVPEVLRSGNHAAIKKWREAQSLRLTRQHRPDLLTNGVD